ncbi:coiled-coil domain-containing protein 174 [Monomorium pharaonis]|uniref:coiled-coil domain-containing protein 174 n=1 Tax=Monomorium pharaonis TaxID=307658 RepID=UPI00063F764D|nr:coiled-coil domain-containing protein 174 [Monomorium pharaonis]
MNMTKKINVNFSSLVGLKAELLRKQAEVNEVKLKTEPVNVPLINKKKSKKVVADDTEKTTKRSIDSEDIVAHKKSKLMLEAKARLYERLKKSKNNNDKFLVDFENKLDEPNDEEFVDETVEKEYPIEPEENWVEYQDCFGRTRKCLREDLPHMQRKDDLIKQEIMKSADENKEEENKDQYPVQEKEPEIEIMRRKWEEQTRKLADKVDIHYQDILFDEARTHGVGYYAFSQDEEERVKQQENLSNLRKETERKQREMKELKELKEKMEQNRLKAARIRQRIRAGLPAEPTEEEIAQENNKLIDSTDNINITEEDESAKKDKEKSNEENDCTSASVNESAGEKEISDEDKIRAFGELLDKKNHWHVMSQEEWVDKCRAQRISEFGPVYANFMSGGFYNTSQSIDEQSAHTESKELDDTDTRDSQKSVRESNGNLQNREDSNNSVSNEVVSIVKDIDNQNDKNTSSEYNTTNDRPHELSEGTIGPTLPPTVTISNLLQRQTTVSYPLSHLTSSYSRNIYGYSEIYTPECQQEQIDAMNIPLPGENISASASSSNVHAKKESLPRSINEDNIMAGLKYLREKFEASHSKWT